MPTKIFPPPVSNSSPVTPPLRTLPANIGISPSPYFDFIANRPGPQDTVTINGFQFHINPDTFKRSTKRVQVERPTRDGYVLFRYHVAATYYTMDGMTGIAGVDEIDNMESFFVPRIGVLEGTPLIFTFPARYGNKHIPVYVNSFEDSINNSTPLYNYYSIELVEAPQQFVAPAVKVVDSAVSITPLAVAGQ